MSVQATSSGWLPVRFDGVGIHALVEAHHHDDEQREHEPGDRR